METLTTEILCNWNIVIGNQYSKEFLNVVQNNFLKQVIRDQPGEKIYYISC